MRTIPDVEKNSLLPIFVTVSVDPRPDHTRRVAADDLDGVAGVLRVDQLPGVPTTSRRHAAVLLHRPSTAFHPSHCRCSCSMDDRNRQRAAAGTTGSRLPRSGRTPGPAGTLRNPVLNHHRLSVHYLKKNGQICFLQRRANYKSTHKSDDVNDLSTIISVRNAVCERSSKMVELSDKASCTFQ